MQVDRIALTSVIREGRSYRWSVDSEVPLGGGLSPRR
jgi:hypothetical protein